MQSNLSFRLMSLEYRLRDRLRPPLKILQGAGVLARMTVVDFGCGPGGFSMAAAGLVGPRGLVYAVDIHPLAVESVRRRAEQLRCSNVRPILADSLEAIPEGTADMSLLYDVLHHLPDPERILAEHHRVLKPSGVLSVRDHRLEEAALLALAAGDGRFRPIRRNRWTFEFEKRETREGSN